MSATLSAAETQTLMLALACQRDWHIIMHKKMKKATRHWLRRLDMAEESTDDALTLMPVGQHDQGA